LADQSFSGKTAVDMRALNFNAGPATLPLPALERARDELLDFAGSGMSVMEHSHRGKEYEAVHDEALALVRELYAVPATHDILFLQGGATQQFALIPMNFLRSGESADLVVTGAWGEKALSEGKPAAKLVGGSLRVACTTIESDKSYRRVPRPDEIKVDPKAAYLHVTSNETIHGLQFEDVSELAPLANAHGMPLICDMSSDFAWRKLPVDRFGMIYAGAQKNLGPSGVVLAIVRKDLLDRAGGELPKIFNYKTHAENKSLYNTAPTFAIYLVRNVLAWVKEQGGLDAMESRNREKAKLLYGAIDAKPDFYRCPVEKTSRSVMNVVFRLPTPELEERFVSEAKKARMIGLKGHRSVGGIRVSLYNAVSVDWTRALVDFMADFAKKAG
jgi:phosphoserine aminotransferase